MLIYASLCLAVVPLAHAAATSLVSSLSGKGFNVTFPGDPAFGQASEPFNLRYSFQPAAVAFPSTVQEVSQVVRLGFLSNHNVVARSGGHSYIANGLGGKDGVIVVDMQNFQSITVDSRTGTAIIGVGNRLGDIVTALNDHGRGMPHGTCPYVGFGGHMTYGGFGFTSRMWGLSLDVVISMNVVLADGTITTASKNVNPDLFWALRGAGGSFGIVTSVTVKTFPAPPSATIFSFNWQFDVEGAAAALGSFQSFVGTNIPAEFGAEIVFTPGAIQGNVSFGLAGGWYGPADKLNATLAPFLRLMPPPHTMSFDVGDYLHSSVNLAGGSLDTKSMPDGHDTFYAKSLMTPERSPMSDSARRAFMSFLANEGFSTEVGWFIQAEVFGGRNSAINAVKLDDTSFPHRSSTFTIQFYASSKGNVPPYPSSGFTFLDGIVNSIVNNSPPNWDFGAYTNYIDDRLPDAQTLYYKSHVARLRVLKGRFDPTSVFSFPTGIER